MIRHSARRVRPLIQALECRQLLSGLTLNGVDLGAGLLSGSNTYTYPGGAGGTFNVAPKVVITASGSVISPGNGSITVDASSCGLTGQIALAGTANNYAYYLKLGGTVYTTTGSATFDAAQLRPGKYNVSATFDKGILVGNFFQRNSNTWGPSNSSTGTVPVTILGDTAMVLTASNGGNGSERVGPTLAVDLVDPATMKDWGFAPLTYDAADRVTYPSMDASLTINVPLPPSALGVIGGSYSGGSITINGGGGVYSLPPVPTGAVRFYEGDTLLGSAAVKDAKAMFTLANLAMGTHTIRVVYDGDSIFGASSQEISIAIVPQTTGTLLNSSGGSGDNTVVQGGSITLDAYSFANLPDTLAMTGTINFYDGGTILASAHGGQDLSRIIVLGVGTHQIYAKYSGDANFPTSTSDPFSVVVVPYGSGAVDDNSTAANPHLIGAFSAAPNMAGFGPGMAGNNAGTAAGGPHWKTFSLAAADLMEPLVAKDSGRGLNIHFEDFSAGLDLQAYVLGNGIRGDGFVASLALTPQQVFGDAAGKVVPAASEDATPGPTDGVAPTSSGDVSPQSGEPVPAPAGDVAPPKANEGGVSNEVTVVPADWEAELQTVSGDKSGR